MKRALLTLALLTLPVLLGACDPEVGDRLRQAVTNPAPRGLEEELPVADVPEEADEEAEARFVFGSSGFDGFGRRAWVVTAVEGAGGAEAEPNPTLVLQVGRRYAFENPSGAVHPLELRDEAGEVLLGQGSDRGSLANDDEVDAEINDDEILFTLSEPLAEALAGYGCAVHAGMAGRVRVVR